MTPAALRVGDHLSFRKTLTVAEQAAATGALVGRLTSGEADEITEHAAHYSAEREQLADAVDEASESASFDFGAD